jgi:hypothetical protein
MMSLLMVSAPAIAFLPTQDEVTCIGCKQCVWHAPACFR